MAFAFQSTNVNVNKIIANDTSSTSSLSLAQFQALIGGSVLHELDEQIGMYKSETDAKNDKKVALRQDITSINLLLGKETSEAVSFKNQSLNDAYTKKTSTERSPNHNETAIPLTTEQRDQLISVAKKLGLLSEFKKNYGYSGNGYNAGGNNQCYVTKNFLETVKENFDNELTDLNSQTETDSIKFQSLMDARKQNLLMLSNMINSDNQIKMSIINNMKS